EAACTAVALAAARKTFPAQDDSGPENRARLPACFSTKSASRFRRSLVNRDNRGWLWRCDAGSGDCATTPAGADRSNDKSVADLRYESRRRSEMANRPRDSKFAADLEL